MYLAAVFRKPHVLCLHTQTHTQPQEMDSASRPSDKEALLRSFLRVSAFRDSWDQRAGTLGWAAARLHTLGKLAETGL